MNVEDFRDFCLSLNGVTEKMPFTSLKDDYSSGILCFYVCDKWFCYVNVDVFDHCCLKLIPEEAEELREQYEGIRPAWHMNKRYWSDVFFESDVDDDKIKELVLCSYNIVVAALPKKKRDTLGLG